MIRAGEIKDCVALEYEEFLMLAHEAARQGVVLFLSDNSFSDPLPELRLRGPELLAVAADYQRSLLFLLALLFFRGQWRFLFCEYTSIPAWHSRPVCF